MAVGHGPEVFARVACFFAEWGRSWVFVRFHGSSGRKRADFEGIFSILKFSLKGRENERGHGKKKRQSEWCTEESFCTGARENIALGTVAGVRRVCGVESLFGGAVGTVRGRRMRR